MNEKEFYERYPALAAVLGAHFYDSPAHDDEQVARCVRTDLPAEQRIQLLENIIDDALRFETSFAGDWELMASIANRRLATEADAREWLVRILRSWQSECQLLRGA